MYEGTDFSEHFFFFFLCIFLSLSPSGHLLVAGLGDTRAIVCGGKRGGERESVVMTVRHNPADPQVCNRSLLTL
jgi:serine/threonine protein phosphatase PrpC